VPAERLADTPIPEVNYDAGETVGWPRLAATIQRVRDGLPPGDDVAVLAGNYGEAGAVDRFAPSLGPAYSGHNSYWTWGPPAEGVDTVIAVGYAADDLRQWFGRVEEAARIDNGVGLGNEEQGRTVWIASDRRLAWSEIWPQVRRLG
jgi:hypothetical protein